MLAQAWQKAREGKGGFVIQNGILFKAKPRNLRSDRELALVLPSCYKQRMRNLLIEFSDVIQPTLGKTHFVVHRIQLSDDTPCISNSSRIPEALKQPLENALNRLFEAGVLTHCSSDFRSSYCSMESYSKQLRHNQRIGLS